MSAILTFLALTDLALCPAVAALDAPRFRTREAISAALVRCGTLARPALLRGLKGPAEVEARSRWALNLINGKRESYCWERSAHLLPRGWERLPWMCWKSYYSDETQRYTTVAFQSVSSGDHRDGWPGWRHATRLWIATALRDHTPEEQIVDLLDRMAWCEVGWTWREERLWVLLPLRL